MNSPITAAGRISAALCLTLMLSALASPALAGAVVHFQRESFGAFQKQLKNDQIRAVGFNKKAHTVHVTLTDGRHVLASYPSHDESALAAQLKRRGVSVRVLTHKSAKTAHHTLRYVAGGILILVILVVLAVLLIGRRRELDGESRDASLQEGEAPSTSSSGSE